MKKHTVLRLITIVSIVALSLACNFGQTPVLTSLPPTNTPIPETATLIPPTATSVPPTSTVTPVPPTPEPAVTIKLGPGKFGHPIWLEVIQGNYQLTSGDTLLTGSAVGVSEDWLTFPVGLVIEVSEGGVSLKGKTYPAGTKLTVDSSGNLTELSGGGGGLANSSGSAILYQDDFTANSKDWSTGTVSDAYGELTRAITDGQYVMTLKSKQDYYIVVTSLPDFTGKDFVFSIDATILESNVTSGNLWLELSLREVDGVNGKHYSFTFYNDGSSSGDLWPTKKWQDVVSLWSKQENAAINLKKGTTNTFKIEANGPNFTLYVNNKKIDTFTNDVINEAGEFSFIIGLNKAGESASIAFDNLVIQAAP